MVISKLSGKCFQNGLKGGWGGSTESRFHSCMKM